MKTPIITALVGIYARADDIYGDLLIKLKLALQTPAVAEQEAQNPARDGEVQQALNNAVGAMEQRFADIMKALERIERKIDLLHG